MYSFVAKEIDYASYFQTVSIFYHQMCNTSGKNVLSFLQIKYFFPILAKVIINIVDSLTCII